MAHMGGFSRLLYRSGSLSLCDTVALYLARRRSLPRGPTVVRADMAQGTMLTANVAM